MQHVVLGRTDYSWVRRNLEWSLLFNQRSERRAAVYQHRHQPSTPFRLYIALFLVPIDEMIFSAIGNERLRFDVIVISHCKTLFVELAHMGKGRTNASLWLYSFCPILIDRYFLCKMCYKPRYLSTSLNVLRLKKKTWRAGFYLGNRSTTSISPQ